MTNVKLKLTPQDLEDGAAMALYLDKVYKNDILIMVATLKVMMEQEGYSLKDNLIPVVSTCFQMGYLAKEKELKK